MHRGNSSNRKDQSINGVGIMFNKRIRPNPYQARVFIKSKCITIGSFRTALEAQTARSEWIKLNLKTDAERNV